MNRFQCIQAPQTSHIQVNEIDENNNTIMCKICDRPSRKIMCRKCGNTFQGRKRLPCPDHAKIIFLMDVENCAKCKSKDLKEI